MAALDAGDVMRISGVPAAIRRVAMTNQCVRLVTCILAAFTVLFEPFPHCSPPHPRQFALGAQTNDETFPRELVDFVADPNVPVFTGAGPGHWDARIRERGWILREGDLYRMWYTGYEHDGSPLLKLGYATSPDGIHWTRHPNNPLYGEHWVEDMMVVHHKGTYYMFAEGKADQAQLLISGDGIQWKRVGQLDVRKKNGEPIDPGPYGTPTAWVENDVWYLFYERRDLGIWLATSKDMKVWTNVQDDPVIPLGPGEYDKEQVALNQIIQYKGRYYAYYHGAGAPLPGSRKRLWCTCIATSKDLVHWQKYEKNPLFPLEENKSSGILVHDGKRFVLYTMHDQVYRHVPREDKAAEPTEKKGATRQTGTGSGNGSAAAGPLPIHGAGPQIVQATVSGPQFHAPELFHSFEDYYNPRLKKLRDDYQLDKVVEGEPNEFLRILKLRQWVHTRWEFDFHQDFKGDAFAILEKAKTGCGFNCAHSMTVLQAVLSCMGYVARYVHVDRNHEDLGRSMHHGVDEVWSNDYAKWVVLDAQYDAHFERDGVPLSALELMLKANQPGKHDGGIAVWLDDKLLGHWAGFRYRDVPELKVNMVHVAFCLHERNPPGFYTLFHDDVAVATSYIGPKTPRSPSPILSTPQVLKE